MSDDIDDMLNARARQGKSSGDDIDSMLAARASGGMNAPAAPPATGEGPSAGARFIQGETDLPVGVAQLEEHAAEKPLNVARTAFKSLLNAVPFSDELGLHKLGEENIQPISADEFDKRVAQREQEYQQARADAGQTGIDWWRLAGQAANPANLIPGGAAASVGGRILQSGLQGAALGATQPSTDVTPGSFWWDKAKSAVLGAATGGVVSSAVEGVMPLLKSGVNSVLSYIGKSGSKVPPGAAADKIVNEALKESKADPNSIDPNVLGAMKQEVREALDAGGEPSQKAIANRMIALSLPEPINLTRAAANGDAAAFGNEAFLKGIKDIGQPLVDRVQENNRGFIANLDKLGAKDAPDPVSFGIQAKQKVEDWWQALDDQKKAAYDAVRNSKGQPAMMDQFAATAKIRDALDTPQAMHAFDTLPNHIQRTIEDLEDGKLPLTVAQFQALDKAWGADARAADGSAAYAINTARRILGDAPIQDDVGKEALAAYQTAKSMHAQQMGMIDPKLPNGRPNPNFQPVVKSVVVDGDAPEKLFAKHFMGEAPSVAAKNSALLGSIDPSMPEQIGRTMMGEIKRLALNSSSEDRGTVSENVLRGWANDPVKSARMEALLPAPLVSTFKNLAHTVETAKKPPVGTTLPASGTAQYLVNAGASMAKSGLVNKLVKGLPIVKQIGGLEQAHQVSQALNPGVTLKALTSVSPEARRIASKLALPGAVAAISTPDRTND